MYENLNKDILNNFPITQISSGFLLGLCVGYFFKKSFKLLLFVTGLVTVAIFWFNAQNVLDISSNNILSAFNVLSEILKKSYDFIYLYLIKLEPVGGVSIITGFLVGIKVG